MHGGYADTAGNGPTQWRLTLFARSLEDLYYYKQAYICNNIQLIILFQYYYANTEGNNIFTFLLIR